MADYWMKLYIEILDDPKMATLPDRLWRRTIEIFLVAKKMNNDGHLPDTRQIAWLLRMNTDDLEHDLMQISMTGIVEREVNGWFIPNFVKRQAAVSDAERQQQRRKRQQSSEYHGNVTGASRNVTESTEYRKQNTETEQSQKDTPLSSFEAVQACLEQTTGVLPTGEASIQVIDELAQLGVTAGDIAEGVKWFMENSGTVRYYKSVLGPIRTARAKRIQLAMTKPQRAPANHDPVTIVLPNGQITEARK